MRLLLLTFYYEPDLSAGSFRAQALVEALKRQCGDGLEIDVLTTMPNRYHSHATEAEPLEERDGVTVRRIPLPAHKSGMVDQSRAFLRFGREALRATRGRQWDVVVATSSRLMTATLGARLAQRGGMPLYLDIRDLFTDTMGDLLQGRALSAVLPLFHWLERWTLRRADRVNLVSPGFLPHARALAPEMEFRVFTNGIDERFLAESFEAPERAEGALPLVVYAGNMGDGQGLHHVLPDAAARLEGQVRFRLIGAGGRRGELEEALAQAGVTNVELLDPVPRDQLLGHYREADVLFLHLNDHAAFRRVLPSKIFEYAATGRPLVAGVAGCPADFLEKEVEGSFVFPPCNSAGLVEQIGKALQHGMEARDDFRSRHARRAIMDAMAGDVVELGGSCK